MVTGNASESISQWWQYMYVGTWKEAMKVISNLLVTYHPNGERKFLEVSYW